MSETTTAGRASAACEETAVTQSGRSSPASRTAQKIIVAALLLASLPLCAAPLPVPEILHYTFDETGATITNHASVPPAGTATATIVGSALSQGTSRRSPAHCPARWGAASPIT